MGKLFVAVLIAAAGAAWWYLGAPGAGKSWKEPTAFMDVRFGDESVADKFERCAGDFRTAGAPPCWKPIYRDEDSIEIVNLVFGDRTLGKITAQQPGGKLQQVTIDFISGRYPEILAIFTERYGRPTESKSEPWQSQGGGVFENEISTWIGRDINIEIHRRGYKVDEGYAVYSTAQWRGARAAEQRERVEKAAGAL